MRGPVLIVDDDLEMCEVLRAALGGRDFEVEFTTNPQEAISKLNDRPFSAMVTDLFMKGASGLDLCRQITANDPTLPVIVITAFGSLETAVAAIRAGAYDFVTKPFEVDELALILERAIQHRQLREEVKRLRFVLNKTEGFTSMVGESAPMRNLKTLLARISDSDASVLISGETGTGKELVARSLHQSSRRSSGAFVAINCAAVPEAILESELFGHTKGAFTDAKAARKGLFQQAHGGTVFLDEIGSMPLSMQPKLLRALQERTVRPVGGDLETPFDARVMAATNKDLETAAAAGTFREDLYFRINVIHVELPPLRARGTDTLLLAQSFIMEFAEAAGKSVLGISAEAAQKLLAYSWPGNVRELRNCMERAIAFADREQVSVNDLPDKIRNYISSHVVVAGNDPTELATMDEVERRYIRRVLEAVDGNKTLAARILGLDRKTLYRKLEDQKLDTAPGEEGKE